MKKAPKCDQKINIEKSQKTWHIIWQKHG